MMRVFGRPPQQPSRGAQAVDAILDAVDRVEAAVAELRQAVEQEQERDLGD